MPQNGPRSGSARVSEIAVLVGLSAIFVALVWLTWGRWGHVRVDAGGAILRAARIAEGATLYKDVQVHYPPLAPYAVGAAFAAFGTHLNTIYCLGLTLVLAESWLLWSVVRRFLSLLESAVGLAGFWVLLAFQPFLFNWIVPNVFAATFGTLFATATVALLALDLQRPRRVYVAAASVAAALAGLAKLEHGLAAVVALTVYCAFLRLTDERLGARLILGWLPGLAVAIAAVLLVSTTVPLETAIFDNIYRQRSLAVLGDYTRARFPSWGTLATGAATTYLGLAVRSLVAAGGLSLLGQGRARTAAGGALILGAVALPLLGLQKVLPSDLRTNVEQQFQFGWASIGWFVAVVWGIWASRTRRSATARILVLVGVFSLASNVRWSFHVAWPAYYAVFAPFLAVLVVHTLVRSLAGRWTPWAVGLVMASFVAQGAYGQHVSLTFPGYALVNFSLEYPRGSIKTFPVEGKPMKEVIDYLRRNTSPGDPVAVLPEEQMINFLAETWHPTRDTGVGPGWLATPADEKHFLSEMEAAGTQFVVISNRTYPEFNAGGIAEYNPVIVEHIESRYRLVLSAGMYRVFRRRDS